MIRHTDLVGEEYAQGLINRLSALDEEVEALADDDDGRKINNKRYGLEQRYDALSDELIRQMINWHRDSYKISFCVHNENALEHLGLETKGSP